MLIGICGSICAGKHTTAEYLVQRHNFLRLHLPTPTQLQPPSSERSLNGSSSPWQTQKPSSSEPPSSSSSSPQGEVEEDDHLRLLPSVTDQVGTRGLSFPDVDSLLDFVTKRWREHWVLTDLYDEATLEVLLRRPFFLLINVDAPVGVRFARFSERCRRRNLSPMPLEDFVFYNDLQLYGSRGLASLGANSSSTQPPISRRSALAPLLSHAHLSILNVHSSPSAYHLFLGTLDLPSPTRLRPTWDAYFMTLASLASNRSNCMKRRVGCVLVHNARIISTGYNGTPRGLVNCNEGGCPRCNAASSGGTGLSTCLCLHAEENALLEAGRERIREGAVLYCDTCPCLTCSVKIAQVGVKEVVYSQSYNMDEASRSVLREAGVELRQFVPKRSGLVGLDVGEEILDVKGDEDRHKQGQLVVLNGRT